MKRTPPPADKHTFIMTVSKDFDGTTVPCKAWYCSAEQPSMEIKYRGHHRRRYAICDECGTEWTIETEVTSADSAHVGLLKPGTKDRRRIVKTNQP